MFDGTSNEKAQKILDEYDKNLVSEKESKVSKAFEVDRETYDTKSLYIKSDNTLRISVNDNQIKTFEKVYLEDFILGGIYKFDKNAITKLYGADVYLYNSDLIYLYSIRKLDGTYYTFFNLEKGTFITFDIGEVLYDEVEYKGIYKKVDEILDMMSLSDKVSK